MQGSGSARKTPLGVVGVFADASVGVSVSASVFLQFTTFVADPSNFWSWRLTFVLASWTLWSPGPYYSGVFKKLGRHAASPPWRPHGGPNCSKPNFVSRHVQLVSEIIRDQWWKRTTFGRQRHPQDSKTALWNIKVQNIVMCCCQRRLHATKA